MCHFCRVKIQEEQSSFYAAGKHILNQLSHGWQECKLPVWVHTHFESILLSSSP